MKAHTRIKSGLLCIAAAMAVGIGAPVQAQSPKTGDGKMMMKDSSMKANCEEMRQKHNKMMAEIQSQDAELADRIAKMNSAPDDQKVAMMAGILSTIVTQRTQMHERMAKMRDMAMCHMMAHMDKESMDECPVMKDAMTGAGKSETRNGDKKE